MKKYICLVLIIFFVSDTNACTCIGKNMIEKQIAGADVIFAGKVISKRTIVTETRKISFPQVDTLIEVKKTEIEYSFEVAKIYKGEKIKDTLKVVTGNGEGDCGYNFQIGKEYIVYAHKTKQEEIYNTSICTRTTLASDKKELEELDNYFN